MSEEKKPEELENKEGVAEEETEEKTEENPADIVADILGELPEDYIDENEEGQNEETEEEETEPDVESGEKGEDEEENEESGTEKKAEPEVKIPEELSASIKEIEEKAKDLEQKLKELENVDEDTITAEVIDEIPEEEFDEIDDDRIAELVEKKKQEIQKKRQKLEQEKQELERKRQEIEAQIYEETVKALIEEYRRSNPDFPEYEKAVELYNKLSQADKEKFEKFGEQDPFKALDFLWEKSKPKKSGKKKPKPHTSLSKFRGEANNDEKSDDIEVYDGYTYDDLKNMGIL